MFSRRRFSAVVSKVVTRVTARAVITRVIIVLLVTCSVVMVYAEEAEPADTVASMNLQAYAPARIVVSYAYTNNFSVVDVSTLGKSLYKIVSSPTSIEFHAVDLDRYTFTVVLKYAVTVEQSIQIALFSSNHPPEALQFNVKGRHIRLEFTLTVTEEPKYPSAQAVAEQVVQQIANELHEFRSQTDETLAVLTRNVETQWVLVGFNAAVSLAFLVVLAWWVWPQIRRLRREVFTRVNSREEEEG